MSNDEFTVYIKLDLPKDDIYIFHEESFEIPIVGLLFKSVKGISSITVHDNQLKISKMQSYSWSVLKPLILAEISDYDNQISCDPFVKSILDVIDEYVNPALYDDNMYAEYLYIEDKKIFLRIHGGDNQSGSACNSCVTSECGTCDVPGTEEVTVSTEETPINALDSVETLFQNILNNNEIKIEFL